MERQGVAEAPWVVPFAAGGRHQAALLGGKGAGLAELTAAGVPVPPGFVVTTEACVAYAERGELPESLLEQIHASAAALADGSGRRFGDPGAPLLVSERSGAPTSMPGMMDTILNVGLDADTEPAFRAWIGSSERAESCRRRLAAGFRDSAGVPVPASASAQLTGAVQAVFESWNSRRARLYRRYHRIEDRGTAVVVQAMVFGNAGRGSGTGVAFTRDPSTGERCLFGEYLADGQGEEVVSGMRNVGDLNDLQAEQPDVHAELGQLARGFERRFRDMCEIEITVERGKLWVLQVRAGQRSASARVRIAAQLAEEGIIGRAEAVRRAALDDLADLQRPMLDLERLDPAAVLATGTGSSPGLAEGALVLSSGAAVQHSERGEAVILACRETSPEDLDGMIACAGLLTTKGGKTSHAAVVARGLGRTCVCGAQEIELDLQAGLLRAGGAEVHEGETISLDGDGGRVILGRAPQRERALPVEARLIAEWARGEKPRGE